MKSKRKVKKRKSMKRKMSGKTTMTLASSWFASPKRSF